MAVGWQEFAGGQQSTKQGHQKGGQSMFMGAEELDQGYVLT
jgi:hypothetical protein